MQIPTCPQSGITLISALLVSFAMIAMVLNSFKRIYCALVGNEAKKEFDFVINGELLRTTVGKHLTDRLIGTEAVVEIECIEKNAPPEPLHVLQHSDWVSCVQCHHK